MHAGKFLSLLLKAITVGLAVAFVVLMFRPDLLSRDAPTVEFRSSPASANQGSSPDQSTARPTSYADAVARAAPAVVNINTTKLGPSGLSLQDQTTLQQLFGGLPMPPRQLESSLGSGVIVSEQGYILTNNHVIEGASQIQVALSDGRNAVARVVGFDRETDLAVLKIDLQQLPAIVIGQSDALRVGDVVLAIGNPFGVGQTVTSGIVSATRRNHLGINTFENFIQTDAAINPGNSGGALIDAEGHLIGINTVIFSRSGGSQGIGFAIPLSLARGVMEQIIQHGHAVRGWLGIEVQGITPALAESFGLPDTKGAIISGILSNGPAQLAGLKRGDIVRKLNGLSVEDPLSLMSSVADVLPGNNVKLEALRNGSTVLLEAKVSERPAPIQQ